MLPAAVALAALTCRARALENRFPKAAAAYVVERDGRPLWGANVDARLPPASLTKMMTALLVIEDGRLERVVAVSAEAAQETGTRLGLKAGERLKARDLLAAAILRSANDACRALADDAAGNQPRFVRRMNERAAALGMRSTHFTDACGHDHADQYSTAADLARLAREAAKRPEYLAISRLEKAEIADEDGRRFSFENTNALVGRFAGALGLKTGTTAGAGTCVAALAERGSTRVLLVMLRARERWWTADAILERAFADKEP